MIIGAGMIAKALECIDSDEVCFFASGVSSSITSDKEEFYRERKLLLDILDSYADSKIIIYFSSCGVAFEETPYFEHKLNMEEVVSNKAKRFYIFRLSQVVGHGGNKNTLFNYLIYQAKHRMRIEVWENVKRNLIDIDDIVYIINEIIGNKIKLNSILNIASPYNSTILEIIQNIEYVLNLEVKYTLSQKGKAINVDVDELLALINIDEIFKNKNLYLQNLIKKYEKEIV